MTQPSPRHVADALVIGSGIAGAVCALTLAERGIEVTLLTAAEELTTGNTAWAQGGIVFRGPDDSPDLLVADILEAGDQQNYTRAVRHLAERGPEVVQQLLIDRYAVPFTQGTANGNHGSTVPPGRAPGEDGGLALTKEGAHSAPRILYCADHTGASIIEVLSEAIAATPNISVLTRRMAVDLLTTHHHPTHLDFGYDLVNECVGAYVFDEQTGEVETVLARFTVLATGGAGQVFLHTTNTPGSIGSGLAMASRAGAKLRNVEYVQFHPTALYRDPRHTGRSFLISEAVRGEGARLKNAAGQTFTDKHDPRGDLAPRDVVTRAILDELLESGEPCVYLDAASYIEQDLAERFPTIHAECASLGIDIAKDPIPVVPAAHYNCGGVLVDLRGRTTMERLYAVGECSCTGVHGANRLASTSLLEGLLWGHGAAVDIAERLEASAGASSGSGSGSQLTDKLVAAIPDWESPGDVDNEDPALIAQDWSVIRSTMWNYAGIARSAARLTRAVTDLRNLARNLREFYRRTPPSRALIGLLHGCETANLIAYAAYRNRQSHGAHYRVD